MFGIQFYPTPENLVTKMLNKVNFKNVQCILEPSAGKGNIIEGINKVLKDMYCNKSYYNTYDKPKMPNIQIDGIEIDTNLRAVLKEKNIRIIGDDFLQFDNYTKYDLIAMNPPFKDGDKHLLKALKILEYGGQCVCILNAETIKNPYSNTRTELINKLNEYHADIEFVEDSFMDAEKKTDVEIALIYVNIPEKTIDLNILKNLALGENYETQYKEFNECQLAENDIIKNLLIQFKFESTSGIKVINDFEAMQQYIPKSSVENSSSSLITLDVYGHDDKNDSRCSLSRQNIFIQQLRYKYWSLLFNSKEMSRLFTEEVRKQFMMKLNEFKFYDFTFSNIKQIQLELSQNMSSNIEDAILKQFDNLTYHNSMDKNTNIHYFNGWKTNSAFAINNKIILSCYSVYDSRWGGSWSLYRARDKVEEIEKILNYLDGGITEGDDIFTVFQKLSNKNYQGEKINCKYFDMEVKKKGTIHIWFNNLDLLKKFNIFGANKKGFLPNSYGKKKYSEMDNEEKAVVDSFEGQKEYAKTCENSGYYMQSIGAGLGMLQIGVSE